MTFEKKVALPGSDRKPVPDARRLGGVDASETASVTVVLRRKAQDKQPRENDRHQNHQQYAETHGASVDDMERLEEFAHAYELTVDSSSYLKRTVVLSGTLENLTRAFDAELGYYKLPNSDVTIRGRTGQLCVPEELEGAVMAVLGLDNRPVAKPHFRRLSSVHPNTANAAKVTPPAGTFTPPQVAKLYNFPTTVNGNGQTVAIIELGGGYKTADLTAYFKALGVKPPKVTAVSVDGGKNTSGSDADGEVLLDIEIVGSIAPGANIAVYFAPNTDQGFVDAITNAVHDTQRKPSIISISWGASEDEWTEQARNAMNAALQDAAALGVTVAVASGDNGSTDGATDNALHVDFPASSPFALACGGTTLKGSGHKIQSETVWNENAQKEGATGGGVSKFFALPDYQSGAAVPTQPETNFAGRGVPDVAGDADPVTGYLVRINGQDQVVGGTSAVAPLWSALIALINQQRGTNAGFIHPVLYGNSGKSVTTAFHDITTGDNITGAQQFFKAQSGWDACTGLGTPNGNSLAALLSSKTTTA